MSKEDSRSASVKPAQEVPVSTRQPAVLKPQTTVMTALVCVSGLLLPGLGHLLLKRWVRGTILLACVLSMFVIGLKMDGPLYGPPSPGNLVSFATLNAFANAGAGLPYVIELGSEQSSGVPTAQTFDYGRVYLAVAGLLNYLIILDAFDIARGRKP